ncbi:Uncharacterized protein PCOAH_00026930 [Plasmodium coatneyi]|uniref:Uncharacterized protein n=1 Tax=Plasmodium coatneyi TaxID=208452 RepID=A0A1B1DZD0_9APIC|nr:Uncharacterized protein PCOAH_00026930 [Plasmodium coatneyi]ANQ08118.1 Uncharacterized protein PCOAH_00026930 [Plasmodium coatneyi]
MKKALLLLSLCIKLLACLFLLPCCKNVEAKNVKVDLDGKVYTILYESKKVKFSDLDPLKIMFHSNHVKHSGNALIRYLTKMTSTDLNKMDYVVRHVDISYDKPLKYEDRYKIIGGITSYGNTSIRITIFGVSSSSKNEGRSYLGVKNILRNWRCANSNEAANHEVGHEEACISRPQNEGDFKCEHIDMGTKRDPNKETTKSDFHVEKLLAEYKEDNADAVIKLCRNKMNEIASQKNCINYFTAHYTIVRVNKQGAKEPIQEKYKNEFPPIEVERLMEMMSPRALLFALLCLYLHRWAAEAINLKLLIDGKTYTMLYESKKVKFSDLDILNIMFHSNQVRHCGNSVICYLLKISSTDIENMNYVVRHIDISYNRPLKYENVYKIIGGVTSYGVTSMKITLFGVGSTMKGEEEAKSEGGEGSSAGSSAGSSDGSSNGSSDVSNDVSSDVSNEGSDEEDNMMAMLRMNLLHDNTKKRKQIRKEKSIDKLLSQLGDEHQNITEAINMKDPLLQEIASKKNCINYFSVVYTLVKVDDKGEKSIIDDAFKNEHMPMDADQLNEAVKGVFKKL